MSRRNLRLRAILIHAMKLLRKLTEDKHTHLGYLSIQYYVSLLIKIYGKPQLLERDLSLFIIFPRLCNSDEHNASYYSLGFPLIQLIVLCITWELFYILSSIVPLVTVRLRPLTGS